MAHICLLPSGPSSSPGYIKLRLSKKNCPCENALTALSSSKHMLVNCFAEPAKGLVSQLPVDDSQAVEIPESPDGSGVSYLTKGN